VTGIWKGDGLIHGPSPQLHPRANQVILSSPVVWILADFMLSVRAKEFNELTLRYLKELFQLHMYSVERNWKMTVCGEVVARRTLWLMSRYYCSIRLGRLQKTNRRSEMGTTKIHVQSVITTLICFSNLVSYYTIREHVFQPIKWVTGAISPGARQPGSELDHWPTSSAEVHEYMELYLYSPIRLHHVVL
jgi:hypothetical protein